MQLIENKTWKDNNILKEHKDSLERRIPKELKEEVLKDMQDYKEVFEALAK